MAILETRIGPLHLTTPLIAASGTVGSVVEFANSIDFTRYGAAVAKSVAPEAWPGRTAPRIAPIGEGMINGIGIQNPGIDAWLDDVGPMIAAIPTQVWASAVAHDPRGFAEVAEKLDMTTITAVEVNLSCPNLDGAPFALDPGLSHEVITRVRAATTKPIGAKLSPDAMPIAAVAAAAVDAGADWLTIGNTVMGTSIDVRTRRPTITGFIGGYSGTPIRPITMRCVIEVRRELPDVPIVACGGVAHAHHAVEYILAGADAVGLGSVHFAKPRVAAGILSGIDRYLDREGFSSVGELKGAYEPWT